MTASDWERTPERRCQESDGSTTAAIREIRAPVLEGCPIPWLIEWKKNGGKRYDSRAVAQGIYEAAQEICRVLPGYTWTLPGRTGEPLTESAYEVLVDLYFFGDLSFGLKLLRGRLGFVGDHGNLFIERLV